MQTMQEREQFTIPIGPQHPALKEPGHFTLTVEGETVVAATARLGYAHRGIEKATEARTWVQDLYLLERVCGICSHIHALAYSLAVERLAGLTVPPRAQAIRTLVAELERLHSHLLWLGVTGHEAGFDTLFMYSWRDREIVLDLMESLTGGRVHHSVNLLGGVKVDVDDGMRDAILRGVETLEERIRHYESIVTTDEMLLQRTRGIAVMTADEARAWGVVGPTARASGVARDVRVEAPYAYYPEMPARLVTCEAGDLAARLAARVLDLRESCRLIRAILDALPPGDLTVRMPRRVKAGETVSRVEAPRGELFYFVKSDGTDHPARIKIRTPTLPNIAAAVTQMVGHPLADVPMILAGIDPCFSCNDRTVMVTRPGADRRVLRWGDLRRYGIAYYAGRAGRAGRKEAL